MMQHVISRLLEAGLSSKLYHITGLRAATSILQKDRFELTPSDGNASEVALSGLSYYLSTSRVPSGGYIRRDVFNKSVIFVLDGRKLGQKYKGAPVDYWAGSPDHQEAEDRVLSKSPFINQASRYITSVHAVASYSPQVFQLYKWCKIRKLPLYFYPNSEDLRRDFITLNPKYRVDFKPAYSPSEPTPPDTSHRWKDGSRLRGWLNLYRVKMVKSPRSMAKGNKGLERAYDLLPYSDAVHGLDADLHNARNYPYGRADRERETADELIAVMRKLGVDTKGYVELMRKKWYPPNR